jgi:GNAT superfamily N-acetyltransferase
VTDDGIGHTRRSNHPDTRPPGYPEQFERRIELAGGRKVFVRPIVPADRVQLAAAIRTADSETLHRRFMGAAPKVTVKLLNSLTSIDYSSRFALVALADDGEGVAVARYIADALHESAEVAVVVAPKWRHLGLATVLVRMLAERAETAGIARFTAYFIPSNRPVAELANQAHARVSVAQGAAELTAQLAGVPGLPHDEPGAAP